MNIYKKQKHKSNTSKNLVEEIKPLETGYDRWSNEITENLLGNFINLSTFRSNKEQWIFTYRKPMYDV